MKAKIVFLLLALFVLAAILSSGDVFGDVTRDTTSSGDTTVVGAQQASFSWSHTCTGSGLFLAVDVCYNWYSNYVDSVVYAGVKMDSIAQGEYSDASGISFGLAAPATGANNIRVYFTSPGSITLAAGAVSYVGVSQSSPYYAARDTSTYGTTPTIILDGVAAGDWVHVAYFKKSDVGSLTPGGGQTNNYERLTIPAHASSYKVAIEGDDTVSYTDNVGGSTEMIAFALATSSDTCCSVYTSPLAFAGVDTGKTKVDSFYIKNCADSSFSDAVEPSMLDAIYTLDEGNDSTYSLDAGDSAWFHITFAPTAVQAYPDTMDLGLLYCADLILSGTGVEQLDTCCAVYTSPLAFGNVVIDETRIDSFYIQNCGDSALIDSIDWANDPAYVPTSDSLYNLAADATQWFTVEFTPIAETSYPESQDLGHDSCGTLTISGAGIYAPSGTRIFYMGPNGNNLTGDGSRENPYLTLSWIASSVLHPGWGDTVMVMSGTHAGDGNYVGYDVIVKGHPDTFLVIMADPLGATRPVIDAAFASPTCWSIQGLHTWPGEQNPDHDLQYVKIMGIDFERAISSCLSLSDGGGNSMLTPAHHIIIEDCRLGNTAPGGNYDALRLIGVDTFLITGCEFHDVEREMIDMVGSHYGTITDCTFINPESILVWGYGGAVMIKGGSNKILIDRCYFEKMGYGGIFIGQDTGEEYFRPEFNTLDGDGDTMRYESKNVMVYRSIFNNMNTPIIYSAAVNGDLRNCTFYSPTKQVGIVDQIWCGDEPLGTQHMVFVRSNTVSVGGIPKDYAKDGVVLNNIFMNNGTSGLCATLHFNSVVWDGSSYTDLPSFLFSHNLWWDLDPEFQGDGPDWDYIEERRYGEPEHDNDITTVDPLFISSSPTQATDFMLQGNSPAIAAGSTYVNVVYDWYNEEYIDGYDYNGIAWGATMPLGAFAAGSDTCCMTTGIAFGNVYTDSTATDSFYIFSCADSALTDSIDWTCDSQYVLASDSIYDIAGGDTMWFTVEFTPTATIQYPDTQNAGHALCADIIFSGQGITNTCCLVTDPAFFGQVDTGTTVVDSFYIHNCGNVALVDSIDWDLIPQYVLASDSIYNIAAGDTVWFTVEFTPTAQATYRDTIDTGHADCYNAILWGVGNITAALDTIETKGHYNRRRH